MDKNYWNYVQSKRAAFTNVKVRDRVDGSIGHTLQEAEVVITNLTQIVFAEIMLARTQEIAFCQLSMSKMKNISSLLKPRVLSAAPRSSGRL